MSEKDNLKTIDRYVVEIWNKGDFSGLDTLIGTNFTYHNVGMPDVTGIEAFKQLVIMYRTAFPDLHFAIEEMVVGEKAGAVRWHSTGTHLGDLMGISSTGKHTSLTGINLAHFQDGKIVEEWSRWDSLELMQQLGFIPPLGQ